MKVLFQNPGMDYMVNSIMPGLRENQITKGYERRENKLGLENYERKWSIC